MHLLGRQLNVEDTLDFRIKLPFGNLAEINLMLKVVEHIGAELRTMSQRWYTGSGDGPAQAREAMEGFVEVYAQHGAVLRALADAATDDPEVERVYVGLVDQFVGVTTPEGTLILASDNAYLYRNIESGLAIAQTLDPASNVAAQKRMVELAGNANRVIPGHDPAVFTRFALVGANVARLTP